MIIAMPRRNFDRPDEPLDVVMQVRLRRDQREWLRTLGERLDLGSGGAVRHLIDQAMALDPDVHRQRQMLEQLLDEQHPEWRDEIAAARAQDA